jgi:glutamyl-tRNA reductase
MEKLEKYVNRYRLLFSATSAKESIIYKEMIENEDIPRYWFDMAIPRDIEDMNIDKLQLFRIDDLKEISKSNYALRQEQALRANEVVEEYKEEFYAWLRALSVEPVIKQMYHNADEAIEAELERAIKKGYLPADTEENIRKMAKQMFKRFLYKPTKNMRETSRDNKNENDIDSVKRILGIDTDNVDFKQYKDEHYIKGYTT